MGVPPDLLAAHHARVCALPINDIRRRLLKTARGWGASEAVAEDLAQGAILTLFTDGAEDWDPAKDPGAFFFLYDAMKERRKEDAKKRARRRTDLDTERVEESPPSSKRGPVATLLDREEAARARDELLRGLAACPLPLRVAQLCVKEGEMTPAEIAERLGVDVKRIYEAQRRIHQEVERIRADRDQAEEAGA